MHDVIARVRAFIQSPAGKWRGVPVLAGCLVVLAGWSATPEGVPDEQQEKTQFPAPRGGSEDAPERLEQLPSPGEHARPVMAAHLSNEHGIAPFSVERHVYLGGARTEEQHLTWDPSRESFQCDLCPGFGFWTGVITDEMVASAQLFNPALEPFLSGSRSLEERDEITRRYLAGDLSHAIVEVSRKAVRRRVPKQPRPTVEHRRARVQQWMLEEYSRRGVVERVIEEALRLQRAEPARWSEICEVPRAASTLRRDWQRIDDDDVEAAKRAFERRS